MGLPAEHFRALTPAEVDEISRGGGCSFCTSVPGDGRGHQYVTIDLGRDADFTAGPGGRVIQTFTQLASRTYMLRTGYTDERQHTVRFAVVCDGCLQDAGRLVDIERLEPLRRELRDRDTVIAKRDASIEQKDARIAELEEAVAHLKVQLTVASVPEPRSRSPKSSKKVPA